MESQWEPQISMNQVQMNKLMAHNQMMDRDMDQVQNQRNQYMNQMNEQLKYQNMMGMVHNRINCYQPQLNQQALLENEQMKQIGMIYKQVQQMYNKNKVKAQDMLVKSKSGCIRKTNNMIKKMDYGQVFSLFNTLLSTLVQSQEYVLNTELMQQMITKDRKIHECYAKKKVKKQQEEQQKEETMMQEQDEQVLQQKIESHGQQNQVAKKEDECNNTVVNDNQLKKNMVQRLYEYIDAEYFQEVNHRQINNLVDKYDYYLMNGLKNQQLFRYKYRTGKTELVDEIDKLISQQINLKSDIQKSLIEIQQLNKEESGDKSYSFKQQGETLMDQIQTETILKGIVEGLKDKPYYNLKGYYQLNDMNEIDSDNSVNVLQDCQICFDKSISQNNCIVYCANCHSAFHQLCYRIQYIPNDDYFCDLCLHNRKKEMNWRGEKKECRLCGCGILPLKVIENEWYHVNCLFIFNMGTIQNGQLKLKDQYDDQRVHRILSYWKILNTPCFFCERMQGMKLKF